MAFPAISDVTTLHAVEGPSLDGQLLARLTGFFFLVTFAGSIPAFFWFYAPALTDPGFILEGGFDRGIATGAILELAVVLGNVATALTLYPLFRHRFPVLALGYVAARLVESGVIALGIVAMMALNTLRAEGGDPEMLAVAGRALVAVHDWTFRIGPGVVVGVGNGMILGYMMWKSRAVPRALSVLGLIGGPGIVLSGMLVILGVTQAGGLVQGIATIPEFFWELLLGLWLLIRGVDAGFRAMPR